MTDEEAFDVWFKQAVRPYMDCEPTHHDNEFGQFARKAFLAGNRYYGIRVNAGRWADETWHKINMAQDKQE